MGTTDSVLADLLDAVLDAATAGLDAADRDIPERSLVTHSTPLVVLNVDQLSVYMSPVVTRPFGERSPDGSPGDLQQKGWNHVATCYVEFWRCAPGVNDAGPIPERDAVDANARELLRDAWAINAEITTRLVNHELVPVWSPLQVPTRADVGLGTWTPLGPQGLMAGWKFNLDVVVPAVLVV
jgi:hypothetical protein